MEPLILPGTLDSLSKIGAYVLEAASQAGLERKIAYRLRLAVDEIATNSIVHGYDRVGEEGVEIIDHTFRQVVILIFIFLGGMVLALLIYRFISERLYGGNGKNK